MSNSALSHLPLVTLYATDRCNSRCISCDHWRYGRDDLTLEAVRTLLPSLVQLGTRIVLLSGGEPLLNPAWPDIVSLLRDRGMRVWLLTSGLSLAKHAPRAAALFDSITVSLDGADRPTYQAIRGLDAFAAVCTGVRAVADNGRAAGLRVTLQRRNFHQLTSFVERARSMAARDVSFLAVDVASTQAFGRSTPAGAALALGSADLPLFERLIERLEVHHAADFQSGFIVESAAKLRHILRYFAALSGSGEYPLVHCNAPDFSAVIDSRGRVQPCFFIQGPASQRITDALHDTLNSIPMMQLRAQIRTRTRAECKTCVCSLTRPPRPFATPA